jgi:hypothetical protein
VAEECWEAQTGRIERSPLTPAYGSIKFDRDGNLYYWSTCYPPCGFTFTKLTRDLRREWEIARTPEPGYPAFTPVDYAIDQSGRVFITGWSTTNDATSAWQEIAVWCFDRGGTALWTNRSASEGLPHGIGCDAAGNVYVVSTTSEGRNKPSGFIEITKLDPSGKHCWTSLYDGPMHDSTTISHVATGPGGLVCFGLGQGGPTGVAAYGDDGELRWVWTGAPFRAAAISVIIDSAGRVVVGARRCSCGGAPFDTISVLKIESNGNEARYYLPLFRTPSYRSFALHVDASDNIYFAGVWEFGIPGELVAVKFDPMGRCLWSVRFNDEPQGNPAVVDVGDIDLDADGGVRIAGSEATVEGFPLLVAQVVQNQIPGRPVTIAPLIGVPNSRFEHIGGTIEFPSRLVSAGEPISYQWRHNGVDIPGATNANFVINNAAAADSGTYSQLVCNPICCSLSSEVTLYLSTPPPPELVDIRVAGPRLTFTLIGLTNTQYQVETSTDLRHWTWCCSRQSGTVSIDKPSGESVFLRVGIYVPTTKPSSIR